MNIRCSTSHISHTSLAFFRLCVVCDICLLNTLLVLSCKSVRIAAYLVGDLASYVMHALCYCAIKIDHFSKCIKRYKGKVVL